MGAWKRELKKRAKLAEDQKKLKNFYQQDLPVGEGFVKAFNEAIQQAVKENK